MKLKRAIIETMGRDDLKAVCNDLEIDGVDRQSSEDMAGAVSRARGATAELLIEYLREKQVKAVCELVGASARGRRGALIERLLGGDGHRASADAPRKTGRGNRSHQVADVAEADDEEEVTWMSAEDAKSSKTSAATEARPAPQPNPAAAAGLKVGVTELVWPRKYDERAAEPPRISLPFQVIEVIEEGRASREALAQGTLPLFGAHPRGPEEDGWRNKLIWGENALVGASLLANYAGGIDLVYIDPPFTTGADFSFTATIGDSGESVEKAPSSLEWKAYTDTWGQGVSSYLSMLSERLVLIRELLSTTGSLLIHVDYRLTAYVRLLLDEHFGPECFRNEIIWHYHSGGIPQQFYPRKHDSIIWYGRTQHPYFAPEGASEPRNVCLECGRFQDKWNNLKKHVDADGRVYRTINSGGKIYKYYDDDPALVPDVWLGINHLQQKDPERTGYPTQKPEKLLRRIVETHCPPNGLVVDLFCGSGTTLAAAEKLERRWIGCDLSRFAIHTTRKRMLDIRVPEDGSMDERGCKPFEVLNLGRYERKYWQGITFGDGEVQEPDQAALAAYVRFVLDLYNAQPLPGQHIHGKKGSGLVHVGAVDAPVTISQVEQALEEAKERGGRELHVLGWEWEMGLHDPLAKLAKAQHGVTLRLLNIPREVMDRRATEAGEVQFFDLAYLEVELKGGSGAKGSRRVKAKLKDFVIPNTDMIPEDVRKKVQKWSDYIDYWAVDWDFRDDTFINQWQTYRTPKDRKLALESAEHTYEAPGTYRVLVKVVDIFGNDTSHLLSWEAK